MAFHYYLSLRSIMQCLYDINQGVWEANMSKDCSKKLLFDFIISLGEVYEAFVDWCVSVFGAGSYQSVNKHGIRCTSICTKPVLRLN